MELKQKGKTMEQRLIDANALMDALNVFKDRKNGNEHFMYGIETAKELLEIQPTVDAVPVVLCQKCKHHDVFKNGVNGWCNKHECPTDVTYFCADGERRSDGEQ